MITSRLTAQEAVHAPHHQQWASWSKGCHLAACFRHNLLRLQVCAGSQLGLAKLLHRYQLRQKGPKAPQQELYSSQHTTCPTHAAYEHCLGFSNILCT